MFRNVKKKNQQEKICLNTPIKANFFHNNYIVIITSYFTSGPTNIASKHLI